MKRTDTRCPAPRVLCSLLAAWIILQSIPVGAAPKKDTRDTIGVIRGKPKKAPPPKKSAPNRKPAPPKRTPPRTTGQSPRPTPAPPPPPTEKPVPTFYVSPGGKDPYRTIAAALAKAPAGARVLVRTGIYSESLVLTRELEVAPASPNDVVAIESPRGPAVLMKTAKATLRHLTLRVKAGAGISDFAVEVPQGQLLLEECTLGAGDRATVGVYGGSADPLLRKCQLRGAVRGIALFGRGKATLEDCSLNGNSIAGASAAEGAELTARDTRFGQNGQDGLVLDGGKLTAENCEFSANAKNGLWANSGTLALVRCRYYENRLNGFWVEGVVEGEAESCEMFRNTKAGLVLRGGGEPRFLHCRLYENRREGLVAGLRGRGLLEACDLTRNATHGAVIKEDASPVLRKCRLVSEGLETVVVSERGQGLLEGCQIAKPVSSKTGVLIEQDGKPVVRDCKISGGWWGVRIVGASGRFENCDISGSSGECLKVIGGKQPVFENCRIFGGKGIGVLFEGKGTATMNRCEVWGHGGTCVKIQTHADPTLTHCTLRNSEASGLNSGRDARGRLLDCVLINNKGNGAGFYWHGATLLKNCRIEGNGVGVEALNNGQGLVDTCLITANRQAGVHIAEAGNPVLKGCTIMRNGGSGIRVSGTGRGTIESGVVGQNASGNLTLEAGGKPVIRDVTGI